MYLTVHSVLQLSLSSRRTKPVYLLRKIRKEESLFWSAALLRGAALLRETALSKEIISLREIKPEVISRLSKL